MVFDQQAYRESIPKPISHKSHTLHSLQSRLQGFLYNPTLLLLYAAQQTIRVALPAVLGYSFGHDCKQGFRSCCYVLDTRSSEEFADSHFQSSIHVKDAWPAKAAGFTRLLLALLQEKVLNFALSVSFVALQCIATRTDPPPPAPIFAVILPLLLNTSTAATLPPAAIAANGVNRKSQESRTMPTMTTTQ